MNPEAGRMQPSPFSREFNRLAIDPVNINGELIIPSEKRSVPFYVVDISEGGVGIWISEHTDVDRIVTLSFKKLGFWEKVLSLAGADKNDVETINLTKHGIETVGKVVWCQSSQIDFGYRVGIQVTDSFKQSQAFSFIVDSIQNYEKQKRQIG